MKIAIVGSGISGLSAAYLLSPHADITLYEREKQLGGHAHTAHVDFMGQSVDVDTGFMVYNPQRYPYFVALLRELGVDSIDTTMSFSVSIPGVVEYSSSLRGLFGRTGQLLRPQYWKHLYEIVRFNRAAKRFLRTTGSPRDVLLGDFLAQYRFSENLAAWYLYPMLGSIWSAPLGEMPQYPAYETFRFLDNHLLLNLFVGPQWRTVRGGSRCYVSALERVLRDEGVRVVLDSPVVVVRRDGEGVVVSTAEGDERYDRLILATHADTTLRLLADATGEEQRVLGGFGYTKNAVILHSDPSYMPEYRGAWAAWNYGNTSADTVAISLTYHMNTLQHLPESCPVFVTLNPSREPDASLVHERYTYDHPVFNASARKAQEEIVSLQGVRATYFAGAHLGFGFHEDGLVSAVRVVETMGIPIRLAV